METITVQAAPVEAPAERRVPRPLIAALAAPGIPLAALSLPLVVYLPNFYADQLGLGLASVGLVFLAVRLVDILFDPFIGGVMDGMETRMGRYRPWLLLSAPMIMLSMTMLFMARPGVGVLYLAGWLVVAYGGWSVMTLAQLALAANASPSYHERSRVYGGCQLAFFIGLIAVLLLPKLLASIGAGGPFASMATMAWLVIVLTPMTVAITCLFVRERPVASAQSHNRLGDYFDLMRNGTAVRLIVCEGTFGLALGVTGPVFLHPREGARAGKCGDPAGRLCGGRSRQHSRLVSAGEPDRKAPGPRLVRAELCRGASAVSGDAPGPFHRTGSGAGVCWRFLRRDPPPAPRDDRRCQRSRAPADRPGAHRLALRAADRRGEDWAGAVGGPDILRAAASRLQRIGERPQFARRASGPAMALCRATGRTERRRRRPRLPLTAALHAQIRQELAMPTVSRFDEELLYYA